MKPLRKYGWIAGTLLIWIVIFSIPSCRHLLQAMVIGSPWMNFSPLRPDWDAKFGTDSPELPLRVNAIKSDYLSSEWPRDFQTLAKLDNFIDENPNLPWLIAFRLQLTALTFQTNRLGGEESDPQLLEHLEAGIPSPEKGDTKINFTPEQLQHALQLCREGEKLEPQNAFFSWMRTCLLMMDWQDEKAWQALHAAAHKTYYDDHYSEFVTLYLRAVGNVLHRPLLPMESGQLSFSVENPLSQTGGLRRICRIINWEVIKYKRAGDAAKTLQAGSDFYHTMFLATEGSPYYIDYLTYSAMQFIAVSGVTSPDREMLKNQLQMRKKSRKKNSFLLSDEERAEINRKMRQRRKRQIASFIAYAQRQQRADLAQLIQNDATKAAQLQQKAQEYGREGYDFSGISKKIVYNALIFALGVIVLIKFSFSAAFTLLFFCSRLLGFHKSTFTRFGKNWLCGTAAALLILMLAATYTNKPLQQQSAQELRGEMHLIHDVQNALQ